MDKNVSFFGFLPWARCLPVFIVSLQPLESKIQPYPLDELCAMS
jgi:hypothetical protein